MVQLLSEPADSQTGKSSLLYRGILVLTDFSPFSSAALRTAAQLAHVHGSKLYLLHTVKPPTVAEDLSISVRAMVAEYFEAAARRMSLQIMTVPELAGIDYEIVIREGFLQSQVELLTDTEDIDLVVAGSHGACAIEKLVLGSHAESLLCFSRLPVMILGPNASSPSPVSSILFATDFEHHSHHAAHHATMLAEEHCSRLTMLHVLPTASWPRRQERLTAEHRLRTMVPQDVHLPHPPEIIVKHGEISRQIMRVAALNNADIIVLSRHHRNTLSSHSPWSTTTQVVHSAPCPVLSVR